MLVRAPKLDRSAPVVRYVAVGGSGAVDIPRFELSSRLCMAVGPGGVFVIWGVVPEAAVEDADEPVAEGP